MTTQKIIVRGMSPDWHLAKEGHWQWRNGSAVVGTVRRLVQPMGTCWAWQVNVPANILQPVEGDNPHGTVKDEGPAKRIVEIISGECGLVPQFDYARLIADRIMEDGD